MREYRLANMSPTLKKELNAISIDIIEEKFLNRKSWLAYSSDPLEPVLNTYGIPFETKNVEDTGWETSWQDYLKDGWLTDSVYYCFQKKTFEDNRMSIQINPALAFGTGSHATTQIAARLLECVAKCQTVLDIGTGSGILSILASKLGSKSVYACDTDHVALLNAKENLELNDCANIHLWTGGIESVKPCIKPTVVVANIITSVLTVLHPHILTLKPKYIVYSGITKKEGCAFISSLNMHGYQPDAVLHMKEWSGVRLKMVS